MTGNLIDEIRDNNDLVAAAVVVFICRRNGMDWVPALALGAVAGYLTHQSTRAKAAKALRSLPHGPEVKPTDEQRAKLQVVPPAKATKK